MIGYKLKPEFIGEIIDIFEDFLTAHGIFYLDDSDATDALIKGDDYDHLKEELTDLMVNWGVLEKEADSVSTALEHYEIIREDEKHEQL